MQPVRRSSSERSTLQYVDEDAPTPRRIARGSLAAGRARSHAAKRETEVGTVRVDMATIEPLLERAKSSTTDMRPLFDRDDEATRPLDYDGVTLPRDLVELSATDVQAVREASRPRTTTGKHVVTRPRYTAPEGIAIPTAVGPFISNGPETTVTNELAYDLLALLQPPRPKTRAERVDEPLEDIDLVELEPRSAIYPIAPVKMAPLVTVAAKRGRWLAAVVIFVVVGALAFGATIAAAELGWISTKSGAATRSAGHDLQ